MPDRKPIGTCWECGKPAFKRRKITLRVEREGKLVERPLPVELCYAHYSQYLRNDRRGRPPGEYTRPHKVTWNDDMYRKLLAMRHDAGMSLREIARALDLTHPQIQTYIRKAEKRLGK